MLVPSMNFSEIVNEVNNEYVVLLNSSTTERLSIDYLATRHKLKIKPNEDLVKFYTIKTKKKNNWLLMISRKPKSQFVKSIEDVSLLCIMHYNSDKGLRFIIATPSKICLVYNEHFFSRYNERLGLNTNTITEAAKHFFSVNHNCTFQSSPQDKNGIIKIIGVLSNGFGLGEINILSKDNYILYYNTFIARDTANFKHAKSLFELEKIYQNSQDDESSLLYEALGFDKTKEDNSQFFEQWESLRNKINSSETQQNYYQVVSEDNSN
jgi:hypothetical protein